MTHDDGFGDFLAELVSAIPGAPGDGPPVAVGWGTVELERAVREFEDRWPGLAPFDAAGDEPLLGAVGRVSADSGRPAFVLLEPVTEGRLAATLARHGEGPVAVWVVGARADAAANSGPVVGPFGPERLLAGTPASIPHMLLLVEPPGTIER